MCPLPTAGCKNPVSDQDRYRLAQLVCRRARDANLAGLGCRQHLVSSCQLQKPVPRLEGHDPSRHLAILRSVHAPLCRREPREQRTLRGGLSLWGDSQYFSAEGSFPAAAD